MSNQVLTTLRQAMQHETPLQVIGVINAYCARMAQDIGYKAVYISGAGIANSAYGLPDLAMTTMTEVVAEVCKIRGAVPCPIIVDADTGFGGPFNVERTFAELVRAGASAAHIEDQVFVKRCGHRENKDLISSDAMCTRIKAAIAGCAGADFMVIARTDALAVEGLAAAIKRAQQYVAAGADIIFAEGVTSKEEYQAFTKEVKAPILANITEFGKTPLLTIEELHKVGVAIVIYPLSAWRAMNAAALKVMQIIRTTGSQQSVVSMMQTRSDLYHYLNYNEYEKKLNDLQMEGLTE